MSETSIGAAPSPQREVSYSACTSVSGRLCHPPNRSVHCERGPQCDHHHPPLQGV